MFEEEENLRSGRIVSDSKVLDKILFDGNPNPARRSSKKSSRNKPVIFLNPGPDTSKNF